MSTDERQKSCQERLPGQLAGRLEDLQYLGLAAELSSGEDLLDWTHGDAHKLAGVLELEELGAVLELLEPIPQIEPTDNLGALLDGLEAGIRRRQGDDAYALEEAEEICGRRLDLEAADVAGAARERLNEYGLALEVKTTLVWTLSTGGPADALELEVSRGRYEYDLDGAVYRFQDWFDGAEQRVTGDELDIIKRAARALGVLEPGIVLPVGDEDR